MAKPVKTKAQKVDVNDNRGKRLIALLLFGLAIAGCLFAASWILNMRQAEISVVRLKSTLAAGDVISADDLVEYSMLKRSYDELGQIAYTNEAGEKKNEQVIIPWDERESVVGLYMTNYLKSGNYLTKLDVTDKVLVRNPWVADIAEGEEIYTMQFHAEEVNPRLLYIGSSLRARITMNVKNDTLDQIRNEIKSKDKGDKEVNEVNDSVLTAPGVGTPLEDDGMNTSGASAYTGVTPVSEIIIDRLVIADMLNSNGESIFDIYMSLLKLPVNDRLAYLQTTMGENEDAVSFQERVTPVSITFIVSKEGASKLAEFEALPSASIKYTILPDLEQDSLMMQFVELQNQVMTQTKVGGGS